MTISPALLQAAIAARIKEAFPGEAIYEDLTPVDFTRPSNLLELTKITLDAQSLGRGAVSLRYQYKITTFTEVDKVHASHLPSLDLRAMALLGAFAIGYVKAADRAARVVTCTADTSLYDAAEVTLILDMAVDRADFAAAEALPPMMEDLALRMKTNEEETSV